MTEAEESSVELSPVEAFIEEMHTDLEGVTARLNEVTMLVEQSQGEVDKLAQRNADITTRLHQIQANFDTMPREDIRATYESSQDAQQRLFTMRGQLEKLEADRSHLDSRSNLLRKALSVLEGGPVLAAGEQPTNGSLGIEQVIQAQEDERRKISRQIHDGPAQALANFILQTEIALRLFDSDAVEAQKELVRLKEAAATTFAQVRDFIFDLRPMMLDDLGLAPTVRRYTEAFQEKSGLDINTVITGTERRLASHREVIAFRAVQEFLANAREHAQATQVKVMLDMDDRQIRAVVEDNGVGFDPEVIDVLEGPPSGLQRLRNRAQQVGGNLEIDSKESGSRLILSLPAGD